MKFYTVYKKSKASNEDCILVQTGFCWRNFFFGIIWAAYKRIWDLVLVHLLFIAVVLASLKFYPMFSVQIIVIAIAVQTFLTFYVNSCFLKSKLLGDGYKEVDLIASNTEEEAFLRFLRGRKEVDNR